MNTLYEQKDLDIARGFFKDQSDKCERFARSIYKVRQSRKEYDDNRENRKIKFIDNVPEKNIHNRTKTNTCQAITMNGKKCSFRASCGIYCKKHSSKK
jgi:hypothetical protein